MLPVQFEHCCFCKHFAEKDAKGIPRSDHNSTVMNVPFKEIATLSVTQKLHLKRSISFPSALSARKGSQEDARIDAHLDNVHCGPPTNKKAESQESLTKTPSTQCASIDQEAIKTDNPSQACMPGCSGEVRPSRTHGSFLDAIVSSLTLGETPVDFVFASVHCVESRDRESGKCIDRGAVFWRENSCPVYHFQHNSIFHGRICTGMRHPAPEYRVEHDAVESNKVISEDHHTQCHLDTCCIEPSCLRACIL